MNIDLVEVFKQWIAYYTEMCNKHPDNLTYKQLRKHALDMLQLVS